MNTAPDLGDQKEGRLCSLVWAAERAVARTRRAPAKRMWINARKLAILTLMGRCWRSTQTKHDWKCALEQRQGNGLARMAQLYFDEHGSTRGDYRTTCTVDYVDRQTAMAVPYCDSGRAGLALVQVTRRRVYAKSSKWYPRTTSSSFLVGRNESGTFFAHAVPSKCGSVRSALDWIWSGKSKQIVRRQGDIAVILGSGPKLPRLPSGHVVRTESGVVEHATHPPIRMPGKGERIIVARRATTHSAAETRD